MHSLILCTCVLFLLCLTTRGELASEPAPAPGSQRRVALVIGNAAYQMTPLRNPVRDATAMATTLQQLGFDVTLLHDADYHAMDAALKAFRQRRPGGVGLFYFAGHGVQLDGENYLIPLQARIEHAQDVRAEAVPVQRVLAAMADAGNEVNILILDACRDNPYAGQWGASQRGLAVAQASSGLFARSGRSKHMMVGPPTAPRGMLIAYATAPGGVAADGAGEHGVYTKHLLQAMTIPGLSIQQVFRHVRYGVVTETEGNQTPWESSALLGDFAFVPAQADLVAADMAARLRLQQLQQQSEEAGRNNPMDRPWPAPSSESYTLIRRIYCENTENGAIQGKMELKFTSPLSCEDAKNSLLVWERQKDHCRFPKKDNNFVDPTARESQRKAKEWVGTPSCHIPS